MKKILIIGGYGDVGKHVVRTLYPEMKENLIIGGRNKKKAIKFLDSNNYTCSFCVIDIYNSSSYEEKLTDVSLIIMCLSPKTIDFAFYCLKQGIHYIDISPSNQTSNELFQAYLCVQNRTATCILGVGICPGLSTLLAKSLSNDFTKIEKININLLLGMGDEYGEDAINWLLSNIQQPLIWKHKNEIENHTPFIKKNIVDFQSDLGKRSAYAFNLADQQIISSTIQSENVSTYFCYDVKFMTGLVHLLSRLGIFKLMKFPILYRIIKSMVQMSIKVSKFFTTDLFAVQVEIDGYLHGKTVSNKMTLTGNNSSKITGIVAAQTATKILENDIPPGAFYIHDLFNLENYENLDVELGKIFKLKK